MAAAGGLIAGMAATPAAASPATGTIITINATSPHFPGLRAKDHGKVDGHAIVIYRGAKKANRAIVSGTVTTAATNDTATLFAEPFGTTKFTAVGSPATLTPNSGVASYSFTVTPSVATQYKVQLAGTDTEASGPATVYVSAGDRYAGVRKHCSRTKCTFSYRQYVYVPTSKAYKTESGKHVYEYLAVGYPKLPKDYTLSKTAKVTKAAKVNSLEYVQSFTFYIPLRPRYTGVTYWEPVSCVRDTESKDGLGLPGHHGCGAERVSRSVIYLG